MAGERVNFGTFLIYTLALFTFFTSFAFFLVFTKHRPHIRNPKTAHRPSITIIVPVYNEEHTLAPSLDSLLQLDYPKNKLKIVIVDDGSKDDSFRIAQEYSKFSQVTVYRKKNGGKAKAINFAYRRCTTELIGVLDADAFVPRNALQKIIGYFQTKQVMAVAPSIKIWKAKNILQKIQLLEYLSGAYIRKCFSFFGGVPMTPGCFTIYRKSFMDEHGPWDENTLTEDVELALRIEQHRGVIENAIDLNVYTKGLPTFKSLLKQRIRWYNGLIGNVIQYRHLFSKEYGNLGVFVLPVMVLSSLLSVIGILYSIILILANIVKFIRNLDLIGYDFSTLFQFDADLFTINLQPEVLLTGVLFFIGLTIVFLSKKYSEEPQPIKGPLIFFFFLYGFIFAFWWVISLWYTLTGKTVKWGGNTL